MAADKNFTWSDEEINSLEHVVIDYKDGKQGRRWLVNGQEQVQRRNQNVF